MTPAPIEFGVAPPPEIVVEREPVEIRLTLHGATVRLEWAGATQDETLGPLVDEMRQAARNVSVGPTLLTLMQTTMQQLLERCVRLLRPTWATMTVEYAGPGSERHGDGSPFVVLGVSYRQEVGS